MTERPILMSAPMVRAILTGTKSQTRRAVKPTAGRPIEFLGCGPVGGADWNNPDCWGYEHHDSATWVLMKADADTAQYPCPYGAPGDRLWVREAFSGSIAYERHGYPLREWGNKVWYWADGNPERGDWTKPRPSIHMPRRLSRITLEVTEVRVERLQNISETDAIAEGVQHGYGGFHVDQGSHFHAADPRQSYFSLWESINGPGSWELNPWVWAVSFRRARDPDGEVLEA